MPEARPGARVRALLVSGMSARARRHRPSASWCAVRRRPDDRAPGDGRAGGRGAARADPGKGTFVAPRRGVGRLITSYTEEMARRGHAGRVPTLLARREQAGPGVARALNITEGDAGHPLEAAAPRRRRPDVHRGRLPQRGAAARLPAERHADQPLRRPRAARPAPDLGRGLDQRRRRQPDEAAQLEVDAGAAVLRHSRRALNGEKVVEVSRSVFRADRYTLWVQIGQEG